MAKLQNIFAKEILDSRGVPTLEVTVVLNDGTKAIASVPSGTSTGKHEAVELRDGDSGRYDGKGVLKAVKIVNETIASKIIGKETSQQKLIDQTLIELDGTPQKSKLGANSILGVSMAVARAAAGAGGFELYEYLNLLAGRPKMQLPTPLVNAINGGKHAKAGPQFQEFQFIPAGFNTFAEKLQIGKRLVQTLGEIISERNLSNGFGLEGGIVPKLTETSDIVELMVETLKRAGVSSEQCMLGIDVAATSFYQNNRYQLDGRQLTQDKMIEFIIELTKRFPIIFVEDPLAEDDWFGWQKISEKLADHKIVGDDLFVSSKDRLKEGIKQHVGNGIIIKANQIGSLTETLETVALAREHGYAIINSHRSGETRDSFLADFSVAIGAWAVKAGAFNQPERMAKYQRFLEIEKAMKK